MLPGWTYLTRGSVKGSTLNVATRTCVGPAKGDRVIAVLAGGRMGQRAPVSGEFEEEGGQNLL